MSSPRGRWNWRTSSRIWEVIEPVTNIKHNFRMILYRIQKRIFSQMLVYFTKQILISLSHAVCIRSFRSNISQIKQFAVVLFHILSKKNVAFCHFKWSDGKLDFSPSVWFWKSSQWSETLANHWSFQRERFSNLPICKCSCWKAWVNDIKISDNIFGCQWNRNSGLLEREAVKSLTINTYQWSTLTELKLHPVTTMFGACWSSHLAISCLTSCLCECVVGAGWVVYVNCKSFW